MKETIIEVGNIKTGSWSSPQYGRIYSTKGLCPSLTTMQGGGENRRLSFKMLQRVGDRDKVSWSVKDYAFTVPSNPMSDRIQLVIETYEV